MIVARSVLDKLESLIKSTNSKKYDLVKEAISSLFKYFKQMITNGKFSKLLNEEQMNIYASQIDKASFHDLYHLNKDYCEYKERLLALLSDSQNGNRRNTNGEKKLKIKCLNILFALIKLETLYKLNQKENAASSSLSTTNKRQRSKNSLELSTELLNVSFLVSN